MSIFNVYNYFCKTIQVLFFLLPIFLHAQTALQDGSSTESPRIVELPQETGTPKRAQEILQYWFGILDRPDYFPEEKMNVWFALTPEIDREINDYFFQDMMSAIRGELNNWRDTARGRLALILLLDQFPRHIYRNGPHAFSFDAMARGLVLEGLQKGDDKQLYPVERAFYYLPLEHAENLGLQNHSVQLFRLLFLESPFILKPEMHDFLRYAIIHQEQIARFGRFPHRNAILGRQSTPEEIVFLNLWGKGRS